MSRSAARSKGSGPDQPVGDVLGAFLGAQRVEVEAGDDPLGQLLQLGPRQHVAQLGLADQHDLQQLAFVGFQVGEQAQLLQHLGAELLGLVDNEHAVAAGRVGLQQELVEQPRPVAHGFGACRRAGGDHTEVLTHGLHQLGGGEARVDDIGHVAVRRHLLQETAADGGLAGADLAGEHHEAATAVQPVEKVGQRLAVPPAHEEVVRVGRDGKRVLAQAEEGGVHGVRILARDCPGANTRMALNQGPVLVQATEVRTHRPRIGALGGRSFDFA